MCLNNNNTCSTLHAPAHQATLYECNQTTTTREAALSHARSELVLKCCFASATITG